MADLIITEEVKVMTEILRNYSLASKLQIKVHMNSNFQKERRGIQC